MGVFDRLRSRVASRSREGTSEEALAKAELELRAGASVAEITRDLEAIEIQHHVGRAWRSLLLGQLDSALQASYAAAEERPYDVDSRIVHGMVCLARNELDRAEHEFEVVIEEFGAEADAADGRRATILARGHAPLDELSASEEEWESAAVLLTTVWRVSDVAEERLAALEHGHPDGRSVIMQALANGRAADQEAEDGAV
ncbi:MAG: hypothetical protein OXI41_07420 [Chloroflexota bacterium]|nr:hypothetical protein [Chloroflexota bacterium]MDE2895890.1 hypothetical protein [Chloroflexota bacterium]